MLAEVGGWQWVERRNLRPTMLGTYQPHPENLPDRSLAGGELWW